jgi:hypothetical protein
VSDIFAWKEDELRIPPQNPDDLQALILHNRWQYRGTSLDQVV